MYKRIPRGLSLTELLSKKISAEIDRDVLETMNRVYDSLQHDAYLEPLLRSEDDV